MTASWSPAPLIPPFRFGTVEPELYRGAYPKPRNLRYLKRLKLRTILSLIPDTPDDVFQEFCRKQGIRVIHLPVDKVKDNVPLTYNRAVEAVQIMIDPDNLPIYVHCLDGASVTGLVVCCLRKLQTWNISSAMGEFLRYLRGGVISSEESVFVEKFASEIEISKPIPPWLWEGQVTFKKHPTLKLNFTMPTASQSQHQYLQQYISTPVSSTGGMPNNNGNGNNNHHGSSSSPKQPPHHYPHQQSTLATPTIAALARIKRSNLGGQNPFTQQLPPPPPQHQQPSQSQSYGTAVSTSLSSSTTFLQDKGESEAVAISNGNGQLPSGLGVRLNNAMIPNLSGSAPLTLSTTPTSPGLSPSQSGSALISVIHHRTGAGSGASQGEYYTSGNQGAENEVTGMASGQGKDGPRHEENNVQQQIVSSAGKNSPAANASTSVNANVSGSNAEPVDEYYEVSMTLKALALEGADF
ncbi:tyrosine-protein phosphatase OCA6 [Entomortierella parvispora]|uniref:Tyrosine-protein phosphatase OCA6 n=1 Tax=Entomortierella parvispora TaxID=205924 RepID=A0A9P3H187_9FUNG|nr:tyrosine-protein phosphatase OCA6 [Entomortierella parvispora]